MTISFYEKAIGTWVVVATIALAVGVSWGLGFAHGKQYWGKKYDWIIEDLHEDINGCRSVLNDPHHCVSVCVKELEKFGC